MLALGIGYHVSFMLGLRRLRQVDARGGTHSRGNVFPVSLTLITAILLLAIGVAAIASMQFDVGPFG